MISDGPLTPSPASGIQCAFPSIIGVITTVLRLQPLIWGGRRRAEATSGGEEYICCPASSLHRKSIGHSGVMPIRQIIQTSVRDSVCRPSRGGHVGNPTVLAVWRLAAIARSIDNRFTGHFACPDAA